MRTTVDLPPAALRRARAIATRTGRSLSSVLADLAVRGLASLEEDQQLVADARTGFPTVAVGRPVDTDDVAALWDDG